MITIKRAQSAAYQLLATLLCVAVMASAAAPITASATEANSSSSYQQTHTSDNASAASMGGDFLLVRPASFTATVVGTGLFVVSLPFSLLSGNVGEAGHKLVVEPAHYTFKRPLGHFRNDTDPELP